MNVREVNLEENMPSCDEAMETLKAMVSLSKKNRDRCLIVIHGYGSTGRGGKIREKARQWLNAQVRKGTVKAVVYGEDFNVFSPKAVELKNRYRELAPLMSVVNDGVTVVEL